MKTLQKFLVISLVLLLCLSSLVGTVVAQEEPELTWLANHDCEVGMTVTGPALIEKEDGWHKANIGEGYTLSQGGHVDLYEGNQAGLDAEYRRLTAEFMPGDLNGDGVVNVQDVALIIQYVLGLTDLTEEQKMAANVRENGEVDVRGATLVMRYSLGIIDTFEPEPEPEPEEEPEPEPEPEPEELTNVIAELDASEVEQTIKEDAEADWEGDYQMQQYQIDNQTEAYEDLLALNIDDEVKETVLKNAFDNWGFDFQMVQYEYENQMDAYNEIQALDIDTAIKQEILDDAFDRWGDDFQMVLYEYENQLEAYEGLD